MNAQVEYPQFRKYKNGKVFFKIISNNEWEEVQVIGSNFIFHQFSVNIMPDRNFIYDMTFDYERNWIKILENEYESIKTKVKPVE